MGKRKRFPYCKVWCIKWESIDLEREKGGNYEIEIIPAARPSIETNTEAILQAMSQVILRDKEIIGLKN